MKNSQFFYILLILVKHTLILRYRGTFLGYIWSTINPVLMMLVMAFVFSTIFDMSFNKFLVFIFSALIPWNFFNISTSQNLTSFINNEGLMKKIYTPLILFPLSTTISVLIESFLTFIFMITILLFLELSITPNLFYALLLYLILFFFSLGIGLVVSALTVFFRDLQHIVPVLLTGLFFISPILYDSSRFEGTKLALILDFNPISPFINCFRNIIFKGISPNNFDMIYSISLAIISLSFGYIFFSKVKNNIIYKL